jgi:hypothetical protein
LVLRDDLVLVRCEVNEEIHEPGPQMVDLLCARRPVQGGLDERIAETKGPARARGFHGPRL